MVRPCSNCHVPIPAVRLAVLPGATECVRCATSKPYKMYDGSLSQGDTQVQRQIDRALAHIPRNNGIVDATEAPVLQQQAERLMTAKFEEEAQ